MFVLPPLLHLVLIAVFLIWLGVLTVLELRHSSFFKRLKPGLSSPSLEGTLTSLLSEQAAATHKIKDILSQIEGLQTATQSHFQKMGFVRFNPYADTGGNQSFCLCLLNDYNDGIVITSLHSREQTRIYAKTVQESDRNQKDFSKEEAESIRQAITSAKK